MNKGWGVVLVGFFAVYWGSTVAAFARGEGTVAVSVDEFQKIGERLQQLEENVRTKDERIRKLEERLGEQQPQPAVAKIVEQHESRLNALQEELSIPFGGEFSLMPGGHSGPFGTGSDFFVAGALDVPLWKKDPLFGQKLLGEIMIGYGRSTDEGVFTSPLTIIVGATDGGAQPSFLTRWIPWLPREFLGQLEIL